MSSKITVHPVENRKDQKAFLNLPLEIYKDNEFWSPPLEIQVKELCGFTKHPFHESADVQAFIAKDGQKTVGRILGIVNHKHNERHNEKRGMFGFFESIDSLDVSRALFDTATDWAKKQGMSGIRGPVNPSLNYELGLLVEGFDKTNTFGMTYNLPYYENLVLDYGFKQVEDLYSFWGHVDMLDKLDKKMAFVVEEAIKRFKVKLRPLDRKNFDRDVRLFIDIYNQSLPGTWGFVPMSEEEVIHTAQGLKHVIVPEYTAIAEVEGKPVGAVFAIPDYSRRLRAIKGRLFPFGFLRLLFNKKAIKKVRMISTNVIPEYQKWGLGVVLLSALLPAIHKAEIQEAEFSWVLSTNHLSRASLERGGAIRDKTYRIYDLDWQ